MNEMDYKRGEKVVTVCIWGNIVLSILKLIAGILGNSKAMVADALHSSSDVIATLVVLIGIKIAKKPADYKHPYGHGKIEPIAAAFVGVTLFITGIMIIKNIFVSILEHSFTTPTIIAAAAAVLSIVVKEIMFRVTYATGKKIGSESIVADAWHHRSDAYSSIATLVGISGSILGAKFGIPYVEYLDPISGIIVACLIFHLVYEILVHAYDGLMDALPDDEVMEMINEIVCNSDGVVSVPLVKGRHVGRNLIIDLKIEVDSDLSVKCGHDIATDVRSLIIDRIENVSDVHVHVEPQSIVNSIKGTQMVEIDF